MRTGRPRDHPSVWFELFAMATLVIFAIAGVGSLLSLVHHRQWNWGFTVERSLPALPPAFLYFGPLNRLLVRWGFLPADRRFTPWDRAVRRAVVAGSLPAGADPEEWRPHIRHRITVLRWTAPMMGALFLAISALTGVAAAVTSHNATSVWALSGCAAVVAVGWLALGRTRLRETHALLDSLAPRERDPHACQVPGRGWQSGSQE